MLSISRQLLHYQEPNTGLNRQHHVLVAKAHARDILLSHANLFLAAKAVSSIKTSERYSAVIAAYYLFLSLDEKYSKIHISEYHVLSDNQDLKRWQVSRQVDRVRLQRTSPSSKTIFEDAKIVLLFFKWVNDAGFITNVVVNTRTWIPNFKNANILSGVKAKARVSVDAKNITILDKENRQSAVKSLIKNTEIKALIEAYRDPVYAAMFKLALGTAMRPMDLCSFPYMGNGRNVHIMPWSDMKVGGGISVDYLVMGSKGNKSRTIKIHRADLAVLEEKYIKPCYADRSAKFEVLFDRKCPPSILFLNAHGRPVTPNMISGRTYAAKKRAKVVDPTFRDSLDFYEARHWWPTMFLVRFFKDSLLTDSADALYVAAAQVLRNQMGHSDLETTYRHYVDMARLLMIAHSGQVHELITEDTESVEDFVARVDGEKWGAD